MLTPNAPITVLDENLNQLTIIDTYQTLYFSRGFSAPGEFTITIDWNIVDPIGFRYAEYFLVDRYILVGQDYDKVGIITEVEKQIGDRATVAVKGRQAGYVLGQRIVEPPSGQAQYTLTGVAETVIKSIVTAQAGTGAIAAREMPLLTVPTTGGLGESYVYTSRYKNLLEDVQAISSKTGLGWKLRIDPGSKKLALYCYTGVDRTAGQTTNPRMIISTDFDTLKSGKVTDSNIVYKNLIYAAGQGAGENRNIRKVYDTTEPTGMARREVFADMRDISANADIDSRAGALLKENNVTKFVDASALVYSQYNLGVDYDLGDYITMTAFGESVDVQITEIKESWSSGSYDIDATFNRSYPEYPKLIQSNNQNIGQVLANTELSGTTPGPSIARAEYTGSITYGGPNTVVSYNNLVEDTHTIVSGAGTANFKVTIPTDGVWRVDMTQLHTGAGGRIYGKRKRGTGAATIITGCYGPHSADAGLYASALNRSIRCLAGDELTFFANGSVTGEGTMHFVCEYVGK